jgi:hypothetical protein
MGDRASARAQHLEMLGINPITDWRVVLDRVGIGCNCDPAPILAGVSNFVPLPAKVMKHFPRRKFRAYSRLQWWRDKTSGTELLVESWRTKHFIRWPYRLTFIADDGTGLLPRQVFRVIELLPQFRMTMLEIAFDFAGELTRREILQSVLFGKARPARSNGGVLRWGNRQSKMAKVYYKPEIGAWRFELELHSRFLNKHRIVDPYDFPRLAEILRSHISLQMVNIPKLIKAVDRL